MSSWRPISLLCVDVKIITKTISLRLKTVIEKCVSENQFCNPYRKIIECNNYMRDILYYANEKNLSGAIINLDWCKAFDSIDHDFLFDTMRKMGFGSRFINWINMFYSNARSSCIINGFITMPFNIERGVRQGCPLSMLLFILSQEPLYRAIERSDNIKTLRLPCKTRKLLGFADDTSVIVSTENSILACFDIIKSFEAGSGLTLNNKKTKLFGIGQWRERLIWPINNINILKDEICILGITFMNDFDKAVLTSWSKVIQKIDNHVAMFKARNVNLFQRAIIINILVLSKVWYVSHTYPLSKKYAQLINNIIIPYIWNSLGNPLKRLVLYREKDDGGINLLNVYAKALSNYVKSFIVAFITTNENDTILKYYCASRLNPLFNIRELPLNISFISTPYYDICIDIIRRCKHVKGFPNISSKTIYKEVTGKEIKCTAIVEEKYAIFDWKEIWKKLSFKFINSYDRSVIFKYVHEILPNRHRLYIINKISSANCTHCDVEENNMHMFYYCHQIKHLLAWFKKLLVQCLNTNQFSMIKLLFFDTTSFNKKNKNTATILVTDYICTIWNNRDNQCDKIYLLKKRILKRFQYSQYIFKNKSEQMFSQVYCNINQRFLDNID